MGSTGGNVSCYSCVATHNNHWGCWFDAGGSCFIAYGTTYVAGNGNHGLLISGGTTLIIINTYPNRGHLWSYWNAGFGLYLPGRGMLQITSYSSMRFWGNTTYDAYVESFGLLTGQILIYDSKIFNIPINQISSTGGLIV